MQQLRLRVPMHPLIKRLYQEGATAAVGTRQPDLDRIATTAKAGGFNIEQNRQRHTNLPRYLRQTGPGREEVECPQVTGIAPCLASPERDAVNAGIRSICSITLASRSRDARGRARDDNALTKRALSVAARAVPQLVHPVSTSAQCRSASPPVRAWASHCSALCGQTARPREPSR